MALKEWTNPLMRSLKASATEKISRKDNLRDEIGLSNMRRLFYFSIIALPICLAFVFLLSMGLESSVKNQLTWRMGVIVCHSISFVILGICGIVSFVFLKKGKENLWLKVISNFAILLLLAVGTWMTAIDQLVTPSITPYILTCNIIALVFLIRPFYAVIVYFISYLVFYFAVGVFQTNQEILLSNRLNGLVAAGLGIFISLILWRAHCENVKFEILNEAQKKELEYKNIELEQLAFLDPLTNLYNRRLFEKTILGEMAYIKRYKHESCMIIIDLDFFKKINDQHGHPVGDKVLKETAELLLKNTRETDKTFRWGGEEFLILLPNTSLNNGKTLAEKLRRMIESNTFCINDKKIQTTASFGVVPLSGDREDLLEKTYKNVDEALYLAKAKGRNRVESI